MLFMLGRQRKYVAEYVNGAPTCGTMLEIDNADLEPLQGQLVTLALHKRLENMSNGGAGGRHTRALARAAGVLRGSSSSSSSHNAACALHHAPPCHPQASRSPGYPRSTSRSPTRSSRSSLWRCARCARSPRTPRSARCRPPLGPWRTRSWTCCATRSRSWRVRGPGCWDHAGPCMLPGGGAHGASRAPPRDARACARPPTCAHSPEASCDGIASARRWR